jgi:hypothetical protein
MTLEVWECPDQLYAARGGEVNSLRPLFTGDVFEDVAIPGIQPGGMAMIIAHPCSMRGQEARLEPGVLMAAVEEGEKTGKSAWARGYYGLMPLPELTEADTLFVARLDDIGKAETASLLSGTRIACLSPKGVNLLEQRFIWRLTRLEVPTHQLQEVLTPVFEEADLLEEWSDVVCAAGASPGEAAAEFEAFIRADRGGGRTLQGDLRDPQLRSSVRVACRTEAKRRGAAG